MNLERVGTEQNINFWFGSGIHFAMEDYFGWNKFGDPRRAFKAYYECFKEEDRPDGASEHYDLGLAMLTYFLDWYPRHNRDMQFKTLWLNDADEAVEPFSEGARPAVEEEFTLDLGLRVVVNVNTGAILGEYEESNPWVLFDAASYIPDWGVNKPIDPKDIDVNDASREYYLEDLKADRIEAIKVKIVPVCYHGTMDRIVVDRFGRWWILDYKTAKGADTRKLDTDDQISAYMWAAEQRYQHPIHGFVYLQLTKEVAKPPKRLKSGVLSVDKNQKTTYALFKEELIKDYGSVMKAPKKMIDMLNHLAEQESPEGDRYIRWDFVLRNDSQKIQTYNNIIGEAKLMLNPDLYLFPNPTRDCGWDCPFREVCIAQDQGRIDDAQTILNNEFKVRSTNKEHNLESWRDNIKWPDSPLPKAEADDLTLQPAANIFNIILPPEYLVGDDE